MSTRGFGFGSGARFDAAPFPPRRTTSFVGAGAGPRLPTGAPDEREPQEQENEHGDERYLELEPARRHAEKDHGQDEEGDERHPTTSTVTARRPHRIASEQEPGSAKSSSEP